MRFLFVESREDRWQHLKTVLSLMSADVKSSPNVCVTELRLGECDPTLATMLDAQNAEGGITRADDRP
ncbi:MAG: hypothetical protein NTW87_00245 [Planctomycetota bacterium]|nr:hypothetical protein [Planctomycetota bacterium]